MYASDHVSFGSPMNHQFFQGAGRTGDSSKYVEELTKLMALEKNIRFLMQTVSVHMPFIPAKSSV